jgi:hypothetical protein
MRTSGKREPRTSEQASFRTNRTGKTNIKTWNLPKFQETSTFDLTPANLFSKKLASFV